MTVILAYRTVEKTSGLSVVTRGGIPGYGGDLGAGLLTCHASTISTIPGKIFVPNRWG